MIVNFSSRVNSNVAGSYSKHENIKSTIQHSMLSVDLVGLPSKIVDNLQKSREGNLGYLLITSPQEKWTTH
jgi:hypothetical protein